MKKANPKSETVRINWAIPNQTITHDEFMAAIKKAEDGSFMTSDEFKQRFEKWKSEKY
jgi:hypothetical protein